WTSIFGMRVARIKHALEHRTPPLWASAWARPGRGSAAGEAQGELEEFVPDVAGDQALDHAIDARGMQQRGAQRADGQPRQGAPERLLAALVEHPFGLEQRRQGLAGVLAGL